MVGIVPLWPAISPFFPRTVLTTVPIAWSASRDAGRASMRLSIARLDPPKVDVPCTNSTRLGMESGMWLLGLQLSRLPASCGRAVDQVPRQHGEISSRMRRRKKSLFVRCRTEHKRGTRHLSETCIAPLIRDFNYLYWMFVGSGFPF